MRMYICIYIYIDNRILSVHNKELEKKMAAYSSSLAWRISREEEPGGLQSMGSQRVGHGYATNCITKTEILALVTA